MSTEKKEPGFEAALTRLEAVVEEMESGSLPLEEMLNRFEEGSRLVEQCAQRLAEVEQRIEILVKKSDGRIETEPFEGTAPETS